MGTHNLRIIVAEDHPVNQLVQRRMLKQLGYQCSLVENGAELLQALEQQEYDLCLLDIQMPVMDGLEAARELRRRGHDAVRLVALTADVTTETRDACAAAGIDEYLVQARQDRRAERRPGARGGTRRTCRARTAPTAPAPPAPLAPEAPEAPKALKAPKAPKALYSP